MMQPETLHRLIDAVAATIIDHADELTTLDQAIGDGDHGLNMRRGFEAVRADTASIAEKPLPEALRAIGMHLVMKVGGASGPLYGTLFIALGKEITTARDAAGVAHALAGAIEAVKARGKSHEGEKTLLDVLVPVQQALQAGGSDLLERLPSVADAAAYATLPMQATRGRASFLGERSVGHIDPGARSAALMVAAICGALEG
jgi:phosphoenolpyruvate---glycerone phosphotransferase subunit DhaL